MITDIGNNCFIESRVHSYRVQRLVGNKWQWSTLYFNISDLCEKEDLDELDVLLKMATKLEETTLMISV